MKKFLKSFWKCFYLFLPLLLCVLITALIYFHPVFNSYLYMDSSLVVNDDVLLGFSVGLFAWFFTWFITNVFLCLFGKDGLLRFRSRSAKSSS